MIGYHPRSIDLSQAAIPAEIRSSLEELSEIVHDQWAATRMAEGWKLGPVLDAARKVHPSIVPYNELPEKEKDRDRNSVLAAVAALIEKGYEIRRV